MNLIFRIEHRETRSGPFGWSGAKPLNREIFDFSGHESDHPYNMPGPCECFGYVWRERLQETFAEVADWHFAYPTLTEMSRWFTPYYRNKVAAAGYTIGVYRTKPALVHPTQVVFNKTWSIHVMDLPLGVRS